MATKPTGLCRLCGAPKPRTVSGRIIGWYCKPCEEIRVARYNVHICGADALTGGCKYECEQCLAIKRQRQKDAAGKGIATRKRKYPDWARPDSADEFWQRNAVEMVARAKRLGILPELDGSIACVDCGGVAVLYEHRDYGRPLEVEPVCQSCNIHRGTAVWPSAVRYNFQRIAPQTEAA